MLRLRPAIRAFATKKLNLNADLGEGFGPWRLTDDAALMELVTSANVACGGHAGDAAGCRLRFRRRPRMAAEFAPMPDAEPRLGSTAVRRGAASHVSSHSPVGLHCCTFVG